MTPDFPPTPPQPPRTPKRSGATWAFVLALTGLCCPPLGIVGGILALISLSEARKRGEPSPILAIATIVLGVLSLFIGIGFFAFTVKANADRQKSAQETKSKLKGRIDSQTLDADTACELARDYFLSVREMTIGNLDCPKSLTGPRELPRLAGVALDEAGARTTKTFCFARAHRWYVFSVPGDGQCPEAAPVADGPIPANDEEFVKEETGLRQSAQAARAKEVISRFKDEVEERVGQLPDEHEEVKCPSWNDDKVPATFVDARLLAGNMRAEEAESWSPMSDPSWRTALDGKQGSVARADAIDALHSKSRYVLVFDGTGAHDWPVEKGDSFEIGTFDGWMTLIDFSKGEVVCDAPLRWQSSTNVGGGVKLKIMPNKSTKGLIADDFESRFKDAASAAAAKMSGGKLKFLE